MDDIITGIQQVGIGVTDAVAAKHLYKELFGMNVLIFDDKSEATLMAKYTGNEVHRRHAILSMNLAGGGGFEIWQFTSRNPTPLPTIQLGDVGIYAIKIKCKNIILAHNHFTKNTSTTISAIQKNAAGNNYFWLKDAYNNCFQLIESNEWFSEVDSICGGVCGAVIGVTNIEKASHFYKNVLGINEFVYETVEYDGEKNKERQLKKVLLKKNKNPTGAFTNLLGEVVIELVQYMDGTPQKINDNRYWGDCGFIHLCFDVLNMNVLKENAEAYGFNFTVDSLKAFRMEGASGRFCYIEDPDGTLIELVETHKIPILKKIGWYLNLTKRKKNTPLPNWMIKTLGWNKVK
jgi:catechol 2,3-dioxygenase-like lactoylglutathione lyase family enzyme